MALGWMSEVAAAPMGATLKVVACVLALRADSEGRCFPSVDRVASDAGLGRTAARDALAGLRGFAIITVESGSRGRVSNRYQLQPVALWQVKCPEAGPEPPADDCNRPRSDQSADNGSLRNRSPGDANPPPGGLQPVASRPLTPHELSRTPHSKSAPAREKLKVRWRKVPEGWQPNEGHRALARELGVNLDRQVLEFRDHEFRDPKSDADAAFRTWLRRAHDFAVQRGKAPGLVQHEEHLAEEARRKVRQSLRGGAQ